VFRCDLYAVLLGMINRFFLTGVFLFLTMAAASPVFADDCSVINSHPTTHSDTFDGDGYGEYTASCFTQVTTCEISSVTLFANAEGTPENMRGEIWSEFGGEPEVVIEAGSTVAIPTTLGPATSTFVGPLVLEEGTNYCVVAQSLGSAYHTIRSGTIGAFGGQYMVSTGGETWSNGDTPYSLSFILTGETGSSEGEGAFATSTPTVWDFVDAYGTLILILAACFLVLALIKVSHDIYSGASGILSPYE